MVLSLVEVDFWEKAKTLFPQKKKKKIAQTNLTQTLERIFHLSYPKVFWAVTFSSVMEISTLPENSSAVTGNRGDESGGFREEERVESEEGDRYLIGSRWPQQETMALLKIRSDMDAAFREAGLKAPLWDEVSRSVFFF